jgi:uncharacterized Rossmann fold enzyme
MTKTLDASAKQEVSYCIPFWLRDEQIKLATERIKARIEAVEKKRDEPVAIVCFGPSLNDTWEQVKGFKYVISCSGSHRFLVDRGVVPTFHVEVDPRPHKVKLIGRPHPDVEYLIASTCHPAVFDHLEGFNVKLWHVFSNEEDSIRTQPHGEWALTGGCSVGLRAMTMARFLGFTDQHIFGMDGCDGKTGKHAAEHPMQAKESIPCEYNGTTYYTTPGFLEAAKMTFHELDQMPDVKATFYGEGLTQAMAKQYVPNPAPKGKAVIGFNKPTLISAEYRTLNEKLHKENLAYGVGGGKHAETVLKIAASIKTHSILDYGCGKGYLAKNIPFPIWEYDPAITGKDEPPRPADLVACTDVLEHIEPSKLNFVLDDIRRCTKQVAYLTIHTGPAQKKLSDGRNAHLIQRKKAWWKKQLQKWFVIGKIIEKGPELYVIVAPKVGKQSMVAA